MLDDVNPHTAPCRYAPNDKGVKLLNSAEYNGVHEGDDSSKLRAQTHWGATQKLTFAVLWEIVKITGASVSPLLRTIAAALISVASPLAAAMPGDCRLALKSANRGKQ